MILMRKTFTTIDGKTFDTLQLAEKHESKLILSNHFTVAIFTENNKLHNVFVELSVFKEKYITIEKIKKLPKVEINVRDYEINRIDSKENELPEASDLVEITYFNDGFDARVRTYEYLKGSKEQVIELVKDFVTTRGLTYLD